MDTTLTAHFDKPDSAQRACDRLQATGIETQALHLDEAPDGKTLLTVSLDDERFTEIATLLEDCAGTLEGQASEQHTPRAEYDSLRAPVWHG